MFVHNNKVVSCWFAQAKCMTGIAPSGVFADVAAHLDAGREAGDTARSPLRLVDP
jgi:hypothetical protein